MNELEFFRLAQCKAKLKLEMVGMKCRGPSAYSQAKKWYGLKGTRTTVLEQLERMVKDAINKA